MSQAKPLKPIATLEYLKELLNEGYTLKGPRKEPERDLVSFKAFLNKAKQFVPEDWLAATGYKFVEPSTFTKNRRIAYKIINEFPDERFRSNYSLVIGDREIPLYLKVEIPKMQ